MSKDKKYKNRGFTLVEVLICVGIIGIIAAITIPALLTSTSEKALEAQRKALYSRMAQAFGQIGNLKLFESKVEETDKVTKLKTGRMLDGGAALSLIAAGLSKSYKLANTCDSGTIVECGIPNEILDYWSEGEPYRYTLYDKVTLGGANGYNSSITSSMLGDFMFDYAAFKTANGESILLYYNPKCLSKSEVDQNNFVRSVCVNMIYDLNGKNGGPNAYGEDIGYITVFYPTDSTVVMPNLHHDKDGLFTAGSFQAMLSKAEEKDLVPPTIEELTSILVNKNLTKITSEINTSDLFWSSTYTTDDTSKAWAAGLSSGLQQQTVSGAGSASHPYFLLKK